MAEPTRGRVLLDERPVDAWPLIELRRSMGYVIQQGGLFPHWTAEENVGLVPSLLGWSRPRVSQAVDEAMELAQIPRPEFGRRFPGTLSGGQRQRVAVARALAGRPGALLLDEPFGALDPVTRERLQRELRQWLANLDVTVVLVTHDIMEAFLLADRIALMARGRLLQVGAPLELALRPASPEVADFLAPSALEVRLRALRLVDLANHLPQTVEGEPCELGARSTPAEALRRMAAEQRESVVVVEEGKTVAGPFSRRSLWALLGEGRE
jgi:osmoprotectant transport system ATP-binding protein